MRRLIIRLQHWAAELRDGNDRGAGMTEYVLLATFIAMVAVAGVKLFGIKVDGLFAGIDFK